jgi:hypothetical protein
LGLGVFVIEGEEQAPIYFLLRHGYQIWPVGYTLGGELLNTVPVEQQEYLKIALWIYAYIVSGKSPQHRRLVDDLRDDFETVIPGVFMVCCNLVWEFNLMNQKTTV